MENVAFYSLVTALLLFIIQKLFTIEKRLTKIESMVKYNCQTTGRDCENV